MASISDMLVNSALQTSTQAPDTTQAAASGAQMGAQLAQQVQNAQMQRAQLEEKKQMLQMQKVDKVMGAIEAGDKFKDKSAQSAYYKNYIPGMIKALKVDDVFNPDLMSFVQQSPDVRAKLAGLKLDVQDKINRGELKGAEIMNYVKGKTTPEELANLDTDSLIEQQKFAASEEGKGFRAKLTADASAGRAQATRDAVGEGELAKKVADAYSKYSAEGGRSGMQSALSKLKEASSLLKSGQVSTGGVTTKIPGFKNDDAQSMLNPKLVEVRTQAQAALNTVLRATLGPQFTEQEGVRVLNQVWDDRQSPAVNAKKVDEKVTELQNNVKNAESEFKRFKYMKDEPPVKKYKIGTTEMDAGQAHLFYQTHPQFKPDEKTKKELGL